MKIEILGTGCSKCQKLEDLVNDVVKTSGVQADVTKVKDIKQIMAYGIMTTPGLVINGKVKAAGKLPTEEQIKEWIQS